MRPHTGVVSAFLVALLALAPLASAKTLPVPDSAIQTADLGSVTSMTWSYSFNAQAFDVENGTTPNGVHTMRQTVSYDVSSAPGGFWTATIGGTWLGNLFSVSAPPTRSYATSLLWNGTAWLNMTTTFTLGGGAYTSPFAWQVCNHVQYTSNGTSYGATKECDRKYWGGNPTRIQHAFHVGNLTLGGQNRTGWTVTFTGGQVTDQSFTSHEVLVPTSNAPEWITRLSSSATAKSGDIAHVTVDYLATTHANFATIEAGYVKAVCDGYDCLAIKAASAVFGVLDHVLTLVFDKLSAGGTAGHDAAARTAEAITTIAALLIGIPITLVTLCLLHPGKSFLAISDYLLMLGIVRYASSPMSDASVIWSTVTGFWTAVGRGIVRFAVWMWGLVERLFQALLDASPITLLIIGGLVLGSAIGALIVKLGGG